MLQMGLAFAQLRTNPASMGRVGSPNDVTLATQSGLVLVGGGGWVEPAMKWMIANSGGGDAVVITASGAESYNKDFFELGGLNSVEVLNITSRELADDAKVASAIRKAEMLFIGGGDQSRYMRFWRGTQTEAAINYLLNEKKVPVGGTSAGCAILSGIYYSGENGSVTSDSALQNPYHVRSTLYDNDLLKAPFLSNVITDQHYSERNREGRHVSFMARAMADFKKPVYGIAPDEATAVVIDKKGMATVMGRGNGYFLIPSAGMAENVTAGQPLNWLKDQQALRVYQLPAGINGRFNVAQFADADAKGGTWYHWYVDNGTLYKKKEARKGDVVMVIHGGAGTITKQNMTPEMEADFTAALTASLKAGYEALKTGKTSVEAVEAAILIMEDHPLFNAGKGAVFTNEGRNELDASIMDGKTMAAGSVAGVTTIKNPISAAIAVMQKSEHVMMIGKGAEQFAKNVGLTLVGPSYFFTPHRWDALQMLRAEDSLKTQLDHSSTETKKYGIKKQDHKFGTVGAVALDNNGNLAAGTSTGGMTNKKFGRVGDAPIIGAGTYADNQTAGISSTGWGEFYIRTVAAHDVSALMAYKNMSVEAATNAVIEKIGRLGGDGGMIALDKNGNVAMPFNTEGMYRGTVTKEGKIEVWIYK